MLIIGDVRVGVPNNDSSRGLGTIVLSPRGNWQNYLAHLAAAQTKR